MPDLAEKRAAFFEGAPGKYSLCKLNLDALPKHVSIIMDGNGRWAKAKGLSRTEGHAAGVDTLREIITASVRLGIPVLSAYAFSTENWKRPQEEVDFLMQLFAETLLEELPLFHQEHVKLKLIGDISSLPEKTYETFKRGLEETKNYGAMTLMLAVNYGSRKEIVEAARSIIEAGVPASELTESLFESHLYTHNLPDPDLLIRTSGELRLSNFLLYQLAYSELYVTDTLWPDFDRFEYLKTLLAYQARERRFGGLA